ncbi:MAG: transcription-repair coupling factor [Helcococcus sp.]|nr:transcription-repair coupling factor [Helcococcus sp.]
MKIKSIDNFINLLEEYNSIYGYGIIDEAKGHLIYLINDKLKRPVFVLSENDKKAREIYENLIISDIDVDLFPDIDSNYQMFEDLDYSNRQKRMKTLIDLVNNVPKIYISSSNALTRKLSSIELFLSQVFKLDLDTAIEIEDIANRLLNMGYQRRNIIQAKGEFSIRGDIIDIFQVHEDNPTRIELFDINVDSIRKFDINTQMSLKQIDEITIYPLYENFIDNDIEIKLKNIKKDLEFTKTKFGEEIYQKSQMKYQKMFDKLEYENSVDNIDLLIPYLDDNSSIVDYLPENTFVIYDDLANITNIINGFEAFRIEDIQYRIENGELLKSHHNIFFSFNSIIEDLNKFQKVNFASLLKTTPKFKTDVLYEFKIRENQSFHGQFDDFVSDINFKLSQAYKIIIYIPDMNDANNLISQLKSYSITSKIYNDITEDIDSVGIIIDSLERGFELYEDKINIISYQQIFRKVKKRKTKTVKNKDIINYSDLVRGDLLVHDEYGIGEFIGIKSIELNGFTSDFMSMIAKFIGNGDKRPQLSNLNGTEWKKSKAKAKRAIEEIAEDLVKLYAKRSQLDGFRYSPDTPWQREFEDSFQFEETDAQIRAIEEIKDDMESNKVMDRLLCGDVGYGKTEVALRAAFKAIMDGKQVVMLAPTTILVKQHFETMKSRFKDFPIDIDYLSRFKTENQKKQTIQEIKKGKIDFVVGTHALLSDKINYKNLGLLIVDEEQRFGVKHKEKIKKMSEDIDVLTLSATPIPRTLQMSLTGIRDMSILDEHPENRLPVNTFVMEYDPVYVREAILREMARGGQVYFVYNRVNKINHMYNNLIELIPEANIAISHGQMSTRQLENVLEDFTNKKYDVLLTTTIIETGMDIQNVNTIIIYNADMMGLSQLYQLKGRIGRSNRNSFAYFTYKSGKIMTEIAEKRLKAIKDFSELGSGYKVAMRDLELRGAGNLLGESQSGHIESIGYDLYVRMLKETIDEIKGEKPRKPVISVKIDLNLDLFIPDDYITDENEKINIYKKISYIDNKENHYAIIDELTDRFGDIPISVQNIIDIAYIKSLIIDNNFDKLEEIDNEIRLSYSSLEIFDFEKLKILAKEYKNDIRFDMTSKPTIIIDVGKSYNYRLINLLETISKINKGEL